MAIGNILYHSATNAVKRELCEDRSRRVDGARDVC
jgi:hypothetical protein